MNTRTLELDISKEGAGTCVKVGQGDNGGTTIKALIYDNGAEFSLSGATAWLVVLLPNKRNYYRGQCSVSAYPMPMSTPPSIWPWMAMGLMTRPESCAA